MAQLTCGAHVAAIGGGPLHPLHDAHLGRAEVAVVHGDAALGPGLPVATDVTHGRRHAAAADDERGVVRNYKIYRN